MPIETKLTLYYYHELSERAKQKAREWLYECFDSSDYACVIMDAERAAECLGITFDQTSYRTVGGQIRYEPDIRWSGFGSQGDGASFNGVWMYPEWNIVARTMKEYPTDQTLHSIARVMHGMYKKYQKDRDGQTLRVTCKYSNSGMSYANSAWMDTEWELSDADSEEAVVSLEDSKIIRDTMRRFADWIWRQLQEQDHFLYSEENIAETMEANEYTFEANGKRRNV